MAFRRWGWLEGSVAIRKLKVAHTLPVAFQPSSNATGSASLSSKILNATEPEKAASEWANFPIQSPGSRGQAAIAAGYGQKWAASTASRLLKQPEVAAALERRADPQQATAAAALDADLDPLEFLLRVMRDPEERRARRVQAASIALPYLHPKLLSRAPGKKEVAAQAAKKAMTGRFGAAQPPPRFTSSTQADRSIGAQARHLKVANRESNRLGANPQRHGGKDLRSFKCDSLRPRHLGIASGCCKLAGSTEVQRMRVVCSEP